jgi:hypothetical protein
VGSSPPILFYELQTKRYELRPVNPGNRVNPCPMFFSVSSVLSVALCLLLPFRLLDLPSVFLRPYKAARPLAGPPRAVAISRPGSKVSCLCV